MDLSVLFLMLLIMFESAHLMKQMQEGLFHSKGQEIIDVSHVWQWIWFFIFYGFVISYLSQLSGRLLNGRVALTCYVYLVINVAVQIFLLIREERVVKNSKSYHGYFKWLWMAGVVVYSGLFVMALQDFESAFGWMIGAGIAQVFYNLAYLLFLCHVERESMRPEYFAGEMKVDKISKVMSDVKDSMKSCMESNENRDIKWSEYPNVEWNVKEGMGWRAMSALESAMGSNEKSNGKQNAEQDAEWNVKPHARPDMNPDIELDRMPNQEEMRPNWGASKTPCRELAPLRKMYGEDYRKLKLAETKTRNIAALSIFFMLAIPCNMLMVMIWEDDISMAMCMAVLHMCMTLAGAGYLVYCWKKAEQDARSMKIGMVYEGMAQVTVAAPLTVQYLMPEGGMVTKYAQPRAWDNFSKDMFVKVMVKDNLVIRIVKEYESITDFSQDVYVFGKPVKRDKSWMKRRKGPSSCFLLSCL